ncbi:2829_t:CDS:1, partial [Gigaspora rosea]
SQLKKMQTEQSKRKKTAIVRGNRKILLEKSGTRNLKPEWQQDTINYLAPRTDLLKISTDKKIKE